MNAFNKHTVRKLVCAILLTTVLLFLPVFSGIAADKSAATEGTGDGSSNVDLNFEVVKGDYEYQIENRPDPFVPFYTGEAATSEVDPNEIVEPKERLSGMQLFEPGQLNLVALMQIKGSFIAMVEDFKGQGYVINEGTKIGKRGIVKSIMQNKVIIEEIAVTRAGKELRSEIVMALRKEGEE